VNAPRCAILLLLLPMLGVLTGCPVTQPQETPVSALRLTCQALERGYWLYVPSYYDSQRDWPLVVTLHGWVPWDTSIMQIMEWKALAEEKGFIVAAPDLTSTHGVPPAIRSIWMDQLASDERAILSLIDELSEKYRLDRDAVLLTGFSAGGYPMYYVGLRHPGRFNVLVARACNSDVGLFESIELTEAARKLPIVIYWGRDDLKPVRDWAWQAYRWLREHKFFETRKEQISGGHIRRPEFAYDRWRPYMPPRHRR